MNRWPLLNTFEQTLVTVRYETHLLGDDGDDDSLKGGYPRGQHQALVIAVAHHANAQSPGQKEVQVIYSGTVSTGK